MSCPCILTQRTPHDAGQRKRRPSAPFDVYAVRKYNNCSEQLQHLDFPEDQHWNNV